MRNGNKGIHARLTFGEQRPMDEDATEQMAPFSLRLKGSLRQALEAAAARRGTSVNTEINSRLEQSFRGEEAVGGAAMQELIRLWVAAFLRGGALGARAQDHPEWGPDQWLSDPFAFKAAVHAGQDALLAAGPSADYRADADPEQLQQYLRLQDFFARAVARGGAVKVTHGEPKK